MSKRVILITGCSSGIGAYCARQLKEDGWLVVASARKESDIDALKDQGIDAFFLDYADEDSIEAFYQYGLEVGQGRIDALFNNGAYGQAGAVEDISTDVLRAQFEANFFGWHSLTRKVLPVMRQQNSGRIVQCSSILGLVPYPWRGAYNASKFALEALTLTMSMELKDTGIKVSLIEPGPIVSKFTSNGLIKFEENVDIEGSHYRAEYQHQLERLKQGGAKGRGRLGPEAVYKVLDHALNADHPKSHYLVTTPAKIGAFLKRVLPSQAFYRFLAKQG